MADSSSGPRRLNSATLRKFNPMVVLAIPDDALRREHADYLRESGFTVLDVALGSEAVRALTRFAPEILVIDFDLPDLDARVVATEIRARETMRQVGVVAVRRELTSERERVARDAGCDAVLAWPCPPATLLTELLIMLAQLDLPTAERR